ncbi:MAG: S-methyl-5'-thioadenosine phosphorylase [Anaerolineae bacterium]|nr:S-methyl-5'-thioadenosine phosphorylase [Anaerolineae bacterium]
MESVRFAIIGGSGLYTMPELSDVREVPINTPFGPPSDTVRIGTLGDERVAFLPRHGRGHVLTPGEVPYRANIFALKSLGATHVIGVSACGSLKEELAPGHVVIPDQLFDFTKDERGRTFFGHGLVAHIGVADPFCPELSAMLAESVAETGATVHRGGAFVTIEGPRFSTRAESQVWRGLGFSIVGMTTSPEAYLAREAEMAYAIMAHVTDYDVWHQTEAAVTTEMVLSVFQKNITLAQQAVVRTIHKLTANAPVCSCHSALAGAMATSPDKISAEMRQRLEPIIGKYYPA